jgi:hypothetical protein
VIDTAGVYDMPMAEYQADPVCVPSLSSGIANRIITQSPLHAWFAHPRLNPNFRPEEANAFDLGSCAHAMLLGGDDAIETIDPKDFPGKKGGIPNGWTNDAIRAARDAARAKGRIPVLADKADECLAMAAVAREALANFKEVRIDLAAGRAEQVLIWQEGDVWCRARPDWMANDRRILLDYKSTAGRAEPNAWIRNQMGPLGYDLQAVHYLRANACTGGHERAQWVFLVQENYPPYACAFVGLSPAMFEIAEKKWELALALWGRCMRSNVWKGYPNEIAYAEPTNWQMDDHEMRRLTFDQMLECATV